MAGHPSRMVPVTPNTGDNIYEEYFQAREIYQQKKKIVEQLLLGGVTPIPEEKNEGLPDLLGNLDSDYEQEEEPSGKRPINSTFQIPKPSTTMQTWSQSVAGTQEGPSTSGTSKAKGIKTVTVGDDLQNTVESCDTSPEEQLRDIYIRGHLGRITAFKVLSESEAWIRSKLSIEIRGSVYYFCLHPNCRRIFIRWYELFLHHQLEHLALQDCKRVLPLRCQGDMSIPCAEAFCDPVDVLKHGQEKHPRSRWVKDLADMLKRIME